MQAPIHVQCKRETSFRALQLVIQQTNNELQHVSYRMCLVVLMRKVFPPIVHFCLFRTSSTLFQVVSFPLTAVFSKYEKYLVLETCSSPDFFFQHLSLCVHIYLFVWRQLNSVPLPFFLPLAAMQHRLQTGLRAEASIDQVNHVSTATADLKFKFRQM